MRRIAEIRQLEARLREIDEERMKVYEALANLNYKYNSLQDRYKELTGHIYIRHLYQDE